MPARYDTIGQTYDVTRRADPYLTQRLIHHLQPNPNGAYLDIACGSGNYTIELNNAGVNIFGVDSSRTMIAAARAKAPTMQWLVADVTHTPFNDRQFNGAICTLATHHFDNLQFAFREIRRVISDSRLVILTSTPKQMEGYWLNQYFPQMMQRSMQQMPSLADSRDALHRAGFPNIQTETYSVQPDLQDFFLYSGKHEPAMYLDPKVRSGISSFRLLADESEITNGCERLQNDLATGAINDVRRSYDHDDGDYLFVIAE